ncbi:5'-3' exonuclease [Bacillaceae bacterium Marseille-Q3522]|nr:5'-3' exonuclease [Bacillaceae bacterium Marseille-Q3522]
MKNETNKPILLLVDGMALLFRAFYATAVTGQFMVNSNGVPTNAVQGFVKHLWTALQTFHPTHVAVCWDMGSQTFRNKLYKAYKANRGEAPVELVPQFELAKEIVEAFDIPNIGMEGYEADDCIGTLAQKNCSDTHVLILTGDQDILQLVDEHITVSILKKGFGNYAIYTMENFYKEKGISPKQIIDLKALMGDASDNYPGVRGIGEKTALKLLQQFSTVDNIVKNVNQLTKAQKTKIEADLEMLYLSRKLAEIHCRVPITFSLEEAGFSVNETKVTEKFKEMEYKGLYRFVHFEKQSG